MADTKKPAELWWLVVLHTFGSIVIATLTFVLANMLISLILGISGSIANYIVQFLDSFVGSITFIVIFAVLLWFSTDYVARFVSARYDIRDPKRLVVWSVVALILLDALLTLGAFMESGHLPGLTELLSSLSTVLVFAVVTQRNFR